jgi:hypothetical protein
MAMHLVLLHQRIFHSINFAHSIWKYVTNNTEINNNIRHYRHCLHSNPSINTMPEHYIDI